MSKEEDENGKYATVAASIMLKLPTANLAALRKKFEKEQQGLSLTQFIKVMSFSMMIKSPSDLLRTVSDLADFFRLVDINGDGFMEWSEFVSFIIEQVSQDINYNVPERFVKLADVFIQDVNTRHVVKSCEFVISLNKILQGVGNFLQFYSPDDTKRSWTNLEFQFPLLERNRTEDKRDAAPVHVCDIFYWKSRDVIFILRSDLCLEYTKLLSKTSFSMELLENRGIIVLKESFFKIELRESTVEESARLFAIGPAQDIYSWEIVETTRGKFELYNPKMMRKHTDLVRDILVVESELHKVFISCSIDRLVLKLLYDYKPTSFHDIFIILPIQI